MTQALIQKFPIKNDEHDTYKDIFENANIGIFQSTVDGHYIRANYALAEMYGYDSVKSFIATLTNISEQLYVEKGRRDEFIEALHTEGQIENFESQVYRQDGSTIWISETARVVPETVGRAAYFEGFVKNITKRKELEAQLRTFNQKLEERVEQRTHELLLEIERRHLTESSLKEALQTAEDAASAKSTFLASMSHELRTPLNAIIGFSDAIQSEVLGPVAPTKYGEYVKIIRSSGHHLLELINDILDLSKIESGTVDLSQDAVNPRQILLECLDLIGHRAEEAGIELFEKTAPDIPKTIIGDARRIKQVFLNLLSNAIKFTPQGGTVAVCVTADNPTKLTVRVADSGVGIAKEDIPKVLSEYGQAEHGLDHLVEGTGLGLPISKKLVEMHGGRLNIESDVGKGTTVIITLPVNVENLKERR